jgi:hypothetical protein
MLISICSEVHLHTEISKVTKTARHQHIPTFISRLKPALRRRFCLQSIGFSFAIFAAFCAHRLFLSGSPSML